MNKPAPHFSKQNISAFVREYVPIVLGLKVPGFIKIHFRYARHNLLTWFILFFVPFLVGGSSLSVLFERIFEINVGNIQLFLVALFLIAMAFFFAERFRKFRRIYVMAIPAMMVVNGLFHLFFENGLSFGSLVVFAILAGLPAWWVGRYSMGKGYRALSDGGDKNYRPGRDLYMDGKYAEAFIHLEPSAKRGHMKSLYLLGHAHEHGNGRELDRVKAARFYDKSSRKSYGKAKLAYEALFDTFTTEELNAFESDISVLGKSELF